MKIPASPTFVPLSSKHKYLIVVAGPTAAGKTQLAIELADYYGTEVLSADSRQFYREMNIGTAKPSPEQLARVKHHFINNKSVDELFGAGHYEKEALALVEELFKTHSVLILVGGSGLYIDALLEGVDDFVAVPLQFRTELNQQFLEKGLEWLKEQLSQKDPVYYQKVDLNNPQRLIRALEVCNYTGKAYSSFLNQKKITRPFKTIKLLISPARDKLYENINKRVDEMMKDGLLDEVIALRAHKHLNALKTVGYSELNAYLEGEWDLKTAVDKIKQHTRNYAKRQMTWFRRDGDYFSFSVPDFREIKKHIDLNTAEE